MHDSLSHVTVTFHTVPIITSGQSMKHVRDPRIRVGYW